MAFANSVLRNKVNDAPQILDKWAHDLNPVTCQYDFSKKSKIKTME
jgi:hypothetical protein